MMYLKSIILGMLPSQLYKSLSLASSYNRKFLYLSSMNGASRFYSIEGIRATSNKFEYFTEVSKYISEESDAIKHDKMDEILCIGKEIPLDFDTCSLAIMKACVDDFNYNKGKVFMECLKNKKRNPDNGVLSMYLKLCAANPLLTNEEEILSIFENLRKRIPIFPPTLCQTAIIALSHTSQWKQSLPLFESMKKMSSELTVPVRMALGIDKHSLGVNNYTQVYASICCAAFRAGDLEIGMTVLQELLLISQHIPHKVYESYLDHCLTINDEVQRNTLVGEFLQLLYKYLILTDPKVTEALTTRLFQLKWGVQESFANSRGVCSSCSLNLGHKPIPETAFKQLQSDFLREVVTRGDIYKNTTPREWKHFSRFIEDKGPFTHILDALNIGYQSSKKVEPNRKTRMANGVLSCVNQIHSSKSLSVGVVPKILVLGRDHVKHWPKHIMDSVQQKADIYYLDCISKDDTFFLYSALMSGQNCKLITNDYLRDHVFKLKDDEVRRSFKAWLQKSQLLFTIGRNRTLTVKPIPSYSNIIQPSAEEGWHIPCLDTQPPLPGQMVSRWLCLKPPNARKQPLPSLSRIAQIVNANTHK